MQSNIVTADQYLLGGINEGKKGEWGTFGDDVNAHYLDFMGVYRSNVHH